MTERFNNWTDVANMKHHIELIEARCDFMREKLELLGKQEPVAWMHCQGNFEEAACRPLDEDEILRGWTQKPLYTTPQQRKPLTVVEIMREWSSAKDSVVEFARAIEAAHGIKE